ncbi:hypothetical protein LBW89_16510, partial [Paenibacillus sp. alder61]|uniref:hypothetical protein n=1 Tax=Paenibacillus sp. alder61 TaxID=2862948 RepID=UPI001CD3FB36
MKKQQTTCYAGGVVMLIAKTPEGFVIKGVFKLRCITKGKGGFMANRSDMSHPKRRLAFFQASNSKKMQICRYLSRFPRECEKRCKSAGISRDFRETEQQSCKKNDITSKKNNLQKKETPVIVELYRYIRKEVSLNTKIP